MCHTQATCNGVIQVGTRACIGSNKRAPKLRESCVSARLSILTATVTFAGTPYVSPEYPETPEEQQSTNLNRLLT